MKNVLVSTKVMVLLSALALVFTTGASAATDDYEVRETAVHSTRNLLTVNLDEKSVICSRADYSVPMLKVLIPSLADVTLLNHQNFGAGAPCVTTGESCRSFGERTSASPEDILQGKPGVEKIEVVVTATRIEAIDHVQKTCIVNLRENVETQIRGKKLFHLRESELASRSYEDCVNGNGKIVAVP